MIFVLHAELVEQTATALQLRLWRDNPNEIRIRTLELPEIAALVDRAETDYYSPLPARLREIGETLYRWLDGGERWLTGEIQSAANQAQVLVLAISMPHGLSHLPWEVMHDGATFLVHALNPPVLPVRWRNAVAQAATAANRPLEALFMASSPEDVHPVLDYEAEEHAILEATRRWPMDLVVEESGCLDDLGALLHEYGAGFFDVLHLTGHAGHAQDDTPVFLLEDSEGRRADATALDLARKLPNRPPLVFVSGCRTGQNSGHGEVRSLAEQLVANGFRAVLGWGRPVRDVDATLAATHVYEHLAVGEPLSLALTRAYTALHNAGARDWHLLRLFCAGDPPTAFVTPPRTLGRRRPAFRPVQSEFLDPATKTVKVATRASFVGRRRLLQRSLRLLREPTPPRVGLLLRGQGGRGKSSVAARLCDRLREFQRVVVIGRLDEPALIKAWEPKLPNDATRHALRDPAHELRFRIQAALEALADGGEAAPLFVLDDFEQNQPNAADGDLQVASHTSDVLLPLLQALEYTGFGRVLITCRYALPAPFDGYLHEDDVLPLDDTERKKQALRLDQKAVRQIRDADLLTQALDVADGNPRLFEWLHSVLEQPGLDHAGILTEMQAAEERFREDILARRLIVSLPQDEQVLLGRMLLLDVPVPLAAVHALDSGRAEVDLRQTLRYLVDLSLVDVTEEAGQPHYRVPRQLGGGDPPLLPTPNDTDRAGLVVRLSEVLYRLWWAEAESSSEVQILELIRFCSEAGDSKKLARLLSVLTGHWLDSHRHQETAMLLDPLLDLAGRPFPLLMNLARAKRRLGLGEESAALFNEAIATCPVEESQSLTVLLLHHTDGLAERGEIDELLRVCRNELLPLTEKTKDSRYRAITLGKIADVLEARGELDEALRIRREEELPVYERLGDVRSRAVTLGQIADVLAARGELDEALRIRREEQLPVFERLGDVREQAVTLGKIADVLAARGELDEALRIRREEQLPVYEHLGDMQSLIVARVKLALLLLRSGSEEVIPEALDHLVFGYQAAIKHGYQEAAQIADIIQQLGLPMPEPA